MIVFRPPHIQSNHYQLNQQHSKPQGGAFATPSSSSAYFQSHPQSTNTASGLTAPSPASSPTASNFLLRQQNQQQPGITVPMRSANIAPPQQYRPPPPAAKMATVEPQVPVQSLSNGLHGVRPIRQVLGSSGQPVFVITRQMKTPSGEFLFLGFLLHAMRSLSFGINTSISAVKSSRAW